MPRLQRRSFSPEKMVAVKPCAFPYSFRGLLLPVVLTLVFAFAFVLMGIETPIKGLCLSVYFHSPVTAFIIGGIFILLSTSSVPSCTHMSRLAVPSTLQACPTTMSNRCLGSGVS